ncbi:ABC transporter ATP-binding protein [Paenibacillus wynnii]|uniref:ABC transporter domain-containing protein n=1 Tax=Paenibacillus wynnii TaxID=268407 RepID=A0A098MCN1_9BACL|nr:ABC transporter ATP-binding protein [Paenibacillus wynnii]KGE19798.1 hypothetical protein PWYN_10950 [Paenibacillus wynnii]
MLNIANVSFGYSTEILQDVNFSFKPGLLYFLLAKNGAGKSTLFQLISGDLKPDTGSIQLGGEIILHRQNPIYFEDMTVKENVESFLELLDTNVQYADLKAKYQLDEIENKVARKLSGGEKQRLYLAITGMSDDDIQLYDEADAALDAVSRKMYYTEVLQQNAANGKLVIAISHHVSEGLKYADRICFLSNKKLYEHDPITLPSELMDMNEDKIMEYLEKECEDI